MSVPTSNNRDAAFLRLLHEVTRYREQKAFGRTDTSRVEGAAIELAAAIKTDEIQRGLA